MAGPVAHGFPKDQKAGLEGAGCAAKGKDKHQIDVLPSCGAGAGPECFSHGY
uniref:Uncharacterized protein n=1 Tax=Arundo donax TaxID=35708 RepID=A0A0A9EV20_ARUDO